MGYTGKRHKDGDIFKGTPFDPFIDEPERYPKPPVEPGKEVEPDKKSN